jgi:hypothetical protein
MEWLNAMSLGRQHRMQDDALARQNRLGQLAGQALSAPLAERGQFASRIAEVDPDAGLSFDQGIRQQQAADEESRNAKLVNMAKLLSVAPEQARGGLYARMAPGLREMGLDAPDAWSDDLMPVVQQLAGTNQQNNDSPRVAAIRRAVSDGTLTPEQGQKAMQIEFSLLPGATPGGITFVEEYDPNTGATIRRPVMNRGLTYGDGPLIGGAAPQMQGGMPPMTARPPAPQPAPSSNTPKMDAIAARAQEMAMAGVRPEIINEFIRAEAGRAGVPLTSGEAVDGMPAPSPAPAPASPSADAAARRTLNLQTFGGMPGAVQSSPTTEQRATAEAEIARATTEARIDAERDATGGFSQETTLRGEFDKATAGSRDVIAAYERVASAARSPTAAGDLSLIFGYMKMLDPGSVVREGEFANAQNAAGVPDRIVNTYNNLMRGERLNPAQRADFLRQAASLRDQAQSSIDRNRERFRGLAGGYGLNPDRVAAPGAAPPGGAGGDSYEVGDVIEAGGKRYRVVGGDPLDPDLEEIP